MTTATVEEAVANIQRPGSEVTLTTGDGKSATLEDPRTVVESLCDLARETDPATDPWPHHLDDPEEYVQSDVAMKIGSQLISRIRRISHLRKYRIHYLFRWKEKWERNGRAVFGQMKRPSGLLKSYAETDFIVLLHWQAWESFNPMQRVALVYHELRHGDQDGKIEAHDFEGFFDELELFGTATYRDWHRLANAASQGASYRHQHSLPLFGDEGLSP